MKKLLMGSICLLLYSISILIFQISCQRELVAQVANYVLPPATTSTLGGVIVGNGLTITSDGVLSVNGGGTTQLNKIIYKKEFGGSFWIANYDGSGAKEIFVSLPSPYGVESPNTPVLSPNGEKLFIVGIDNTSTVPGHAIFVCNSDGTNPVQIINLGQIASYIFMVDAY